MKKGGRWGETGHRRSNATNSSNRKSRQSSATDQGADGKVNYSLSLFFRGQVFSLPSLQPLLILLSCCCEVLSPTVRAGGKFGPDIALSASHEALKIRTASDSLHPSTGRWRLREKGKLIRAGIKSCPDVRLDFSASVTSLRLRQTSLTFENISKYMTLRTIMKQTPLCTNCVWITTC